MSPTLTTLSVAAFTINTPLGVLREKYTEPLTLPWLFILHAGVPLVILLRRRLGVPGRMMTVGVSIGASVVGQVVGARM
ncbi:hypothetical protein HK102_008843, partial [Quaeritorhiza haematococci]